MILRDELGEARVTDKFTVETTNTAGLMEEPIVVSGVSPVTDCGVVDAVASRPLPEAPPAELGMWPYLIPPVASSLEIKEKGLPREPDANA